MNNSNDRPKRSRRSGVQSVETRSP